MDVLLRRRFGLPPDPWGAAPTLDSADAIRAGHLVRAAVEARILVSIHGPRGAGKTHAVRAALAGRGVQLVEPLRLDRERLHLGDVQSALIRELGDGESPRHSGEARGGQTRRVLGAASARGAVVLWIDDAHVLHPSTLRGLKRLLEVRWQGRGPLLGVILTGQADRTARVPEVGLRADRTALAGLTAAEAERAVHAAPRRARRCRGRGGHRRERAGPELARSPAPGRRLPRRRGRAGRGPHHRRRGRGPCSGPAPRRRRATRPSPTS